MKKKANGFTLIEILVSVSIMLFIAVGIYGVSNIGERTYATDMGLLELQQQVRQSMSGMTREIRQTYNSNITISNSTINFSIPINITSASYSDPINYYRNGNNIIRNHSTDPYKIIATDINDLNFCCENSDGTVCDDVCNNRHIVKIELKAQKTVNNKVVSFPANGTIIGKVRLRN